MKDVELRVGRLLTHRPAFNFPKIRVKFDELVIEGALKNLEVFNLTQDRIEVIKLVVKDELDFRIQFKVDQLEN